MVLVLEPSCNLDGVGSPPALLVVVVVSYRVACILLWITKEDTLDTPGGFNSSGPVATCSIVQFNAPPRLFLERLWSFSTLKSQSPKLSPSQSSWKLCHLPPAQLHLWKIVVLFFGLSYCSLLSKKCILNLDSSVPSFTPL